MLRRDQNFVPAEGKWDGLVENGPQVRRFVVRFEPVIMRDQKYDFDT